MKHILYLITYEETNPVISQFPLNAIFPTSEAAGVRVYITDYTSKTFVLSYLSNVQLKQAFYKLLNSVGTHSAENKQTSDTTVIMVLFLAKWGCLSD